MPSRNGGTTVGPGGRHNIQAGATLDGAANKAVGDLAVDDGVLTPAAVALGKPGAGADADVAAARPVVAVACAAAGPVSPSENAKTMHSRITRRKPKIGVRVPFSAGGRERHCHKSCFASMGTEQRK